MNLAQLHEKLRLELVRRIERGTLSGALLARQTGFRQSHISNFLRRRRTLSLEAIDRVLDATALSLRDLLPNSDASSAQPLYEFVHDDLGSVTIPVVSQSTAMHDRYIASRTTLDLLTIPAAMLADARPRCSASRREWQRFVAVRVTAHQAAPMQPVLQPHSLVLIDRHYCSLTSYHLSEATLYAVRYGGALRFRYASFSANRLVLRPYNFPHEIELVELSPDETPSDALIGRICLSLAAF